MTVPSGMDTVFIDETFDINQTKSYHISIQAGLNGYSFSVFDPLNNKYILLKHFAFKPTLTDAKLEEKITEINGNDEFLTREYRSALFSYQSPRYTLIPAPLFNKDNLKTYFEFNHFLDESDEIHYNGLKNIDAYNLFVIPEPLSVALQKAFSGVRFFSQATPLVEHGLVFYGGKRTRKVVMTNIYGHNTDVVVVEGDHLLLCNTFPWKNEQDLVWFIMYVYEQLKLSGSEIPLVISGELRKTSPVFDMLRSYIRNIRFEKHNDHFKYSYTFNKIDHHWFTNLFNLRLCV